MSCKGCPALTPIPFADRLPKKQAAPVSPVTWAQATKQFFKSVKKFAQSGAKMVSQQEHARRTAICQGCRYRDGASCTQCRCVIIIKAKAATEHCPIRRW